MIQHGISDVVRGIEANGGSKRSVGAESTRMEGRDGGFGGGIDAARVGGCEVALDGVAYRDDRELDVILVVRSNGGSREEGDGREAANIGGNLRFGGGRISCFPL